MEISGFFPIKLTDKARFDFYFQHFPPEISEYTFTNLYIWRNYYQFLWKEENNHLFLIALKDPNSIIAFPPIGPIPPAELQIYHTIAHTLNRPLEIHRVPENYIRTIQNDSIQCQIIEDRNNWDYLYARESLVTLAGGDLFNERKKLNKFNRLYKWEYISLDQSQLAACRTLQEKWCGDIRHCIDDEGLIQEHHAILDALDHWDVLQFNGGILLVDGKIIAFSLGEPLNPTTYVIHIEKANPEYIGAYQAINQQFTEHGTKNYTFINREQDLGESTLRRAKENYHPTNYVRKWKIIF